MYGPGAATQRILTIVFGALVLFVAVAMVSRYLVRPIAGFLGWPLQKLSPVSGRLARDNSVRNPGRTALTAAALMIGLAVVVLVAVLAQGLKSSFIDSFDRTVAADYVIAGKNFIPLPADTARRVQSVPTVQNAAELNLQQVQVNGQVAGLMGVDPYSFRNVWNFDWVDGGNDRLLGRLGLTNALVEQQTAQGLGIATGDTVTIRTVDGVEHDFTIVGEYYDPVMLNGVMVSTAAYNEIFPKPQVLMVFATATPGADEKQTLDAVKAALADVPTADAQTAEEYKDQTVSLVNQLLNLLYGLLAVSVIISLIGIINTLVLAVYERTREIGLVRAIGMSRRQVRATVRYESIITSVIGAVLGIVVGVALGYVVTVRLEEQGIHFALPGLQLVVFLIVGVVVGVLAAILPARRAARIDILEAIHYE
jgi:putative ABC transport system permease protein